MILPTGTLLHGGTYRIERDLGQGGFGITYLAEQVMLGRKVAIKEFYMKQYCDRNEFSRVSYSTEANKELVSKCKDKFLKEARMIASLEHPNIVKVYDIFEENNTAYYVMEYIDGYPLDKLMEKGAMSEPTAVNYVIQVGKALEYIHNRNILHLDVKPANILLRKNGSIVLIDFGISKHYDSNGNQTSTMQGALSKGYSPLEQGNGLLQDFTAATDVYSLGATLMALLTGQAPPDALSIMNNGLPDRPSNTSSQIWSVIDKAMRPRRKDRTQTVKDFLVSLPNISTANLVKASATNSNSEETQLIGQLHSDKADTVSQTAAKDEETEVFTSSALNHGSSDKSGQNVVDTKSKKAHKTACQEKKILHKSVKTSKSFFYMPFVYGLFALFAIAVGLIKCSWWWIGADMVYGLNHYFIEPLFIFAYFMSYQKIINKYESLYKILCFAILLIAFIRIFIDYDEWIKTGYWFYVPGFRFAEDFLIYYSIEFITFLLSMIGIAVTKITSIKISFLLMVTSGICTIIAPNVDVLAYLYIVSWICYFLSPLTVFGFYYKKSKRPHS